MRARIVFVVTGLGTGGAETALLRLASRLDRDRFEPSLVSLRERGPLAEAFEAAGVPVRALGMRPRTPRPGAVATLVRWIRSARPALVQTWMYHADLLGGIAARRAGAAAVVWGVHHAELRAGSAGLATMAVARACALLSRRIPARIVCCAESARRRHVAMGYDAARTLVIGNGVDPETFRPDAAARAAVRRELNIDAVAPVVAHVARHHPDKDHATFLAAAAIVARAVPGTRFVLCGESIDARLAGRVAALGLSDACRLLGVRRDMPQLLAAADVAVSSSRSEAMPNAVIEAMACGVPCVVTDVGDCATVVGDAGRIVPPGDPHALAAACASVLRAGVPARAALGARARRRAVERFGIDAAVRRYEALYADLAGLWRRPCAV